MNSVDSNTGVDLGSDCRVFSSQQLHQTPRYQAEGMYVGLASSICLLIPWVG